MGKRKGIPKNSDRAYLTQCVGKLMAYYIMGHYVEAEIWAKKLVTHLQGMGLYPK